MPTVHEIHNISQLLSTKSATAASSCVFDICYHYQLLYTVSATTTSCCIQYLLPPPAVVYSICYHHQLLITLVLPLQAGIPAPGAAICEVELVKDEDGGHDGLVEQLGQRPVNPVQGAAEPRPRHPHPGQHEAVVDNQEHGKGPALRKQAAQLSGGETGA